ILLGLVAVLALSTGCASRTETVRALEGAIRRELPIGTPVTEVEGSLRRERISPDRRGQRPHPENSDADASAVFGTVTASVPVEDSVIFQNSKIHIVFYFDRDDRLVSHSTQFTYSTHP